MHPDSMHPDTHTRAVARPHTSAVCSVHGYSRCQVFGRPLVGVLHLAAVDLRGRLVAALTQRGLQAQHGAPPCLEVGEPVSVGPVEAAPLALALGIPLGRKQLVHGGQRRHHRQRRQLHRCAGRHGGLAQCSAGVRERGDGLNSVALDCGLSHSVRDTVYGRQSACLPAQLQLAPPLQRTLHPVLLLWISDFLLAATGAQEGFLSSEHRRYSDEGHTGTLYGTPLIDRLLPTRA